MTVHSLDCIAEQRHLDYLAELAKEWEFKWPNHCDGCYGWGCFDASDPSVGIWGLEPCEECLCKGNCPRCGEFIWTEEQLEFMWEKNIPAMCSKCNWYEEDKDRGKPEVDGLYCFCFEDEKLNPNAIITPHA